MKVDSKEKEQLEKKDIFREGEKNEPASLTSKSLITRALLIILGLVVFVTLIVRFYPWLNTLIIKQEDISETEATIVERVNFVEEEINQLREQVNTLTKWQRQVLAEPALKSTLLERLTLLEKWQKTAQQDLKTLLSESSSLAQGLQRDNSFLSEEKDNLLKRVEALEKAQLQQTIHLQRLPQVLRAFESLRLVLETSRPFLKELENLKAKVGPQVIQIADYLKTLEEFAPYGVLTLTQLRIEIASLIPHIRALPSQEETNLWTQFLHKLSHLIVIRKVNIPQEGLLNLDNIFQEIDLSLSQGALSEAIALAQKIPAYNDVEVWLTHAHERAQVIEIMSTLEVMILTNLLSYPELNLSSENNSEMFIPKGKF